MGERLKVQRPFQLLYVDFMGPYPKTKSGNCFIFVGLDSVTRFPFLIPMRTATSKRVVTFLSKELFPLIGVPEQIFSDNGSQFISKLFEDCLTKHGITHLKSPFYTPQANAAERVNRSVVAAVRAYIKKHSDWDETLHLITAALRSGHHQAIGTSPYFSVFGQHMIHSGQDYKLLRKLDSLGGTEINVLPKESCLQIIRSFVENNLDNSHERNRQRHNRKCKTTLYKIGDELWRRNFILSDSKLGITKKFARKYIKCRVRKVLGDHRYEIEDEKGKYVGIYHGQHLTRINK